MPKPRHFVVPIVPIALALFVVWPAQRTPAPTTAPAPAPSAQIALPNKAGSARFAVIGDSGSGEAGQTTVAKLMMKRRGTFAFDRVIMLGDNIYTSVFQTTQGARDFTEKFEKPYKPLLDAGVKFYAALGNHDDQNNRFYPGFNMDGKRFYSHSIKNVRFFVLDTDMLDPEQMKWLENELKDSRDEWKIPYFHHPIYSDGSKHGSAIDLRVMLEPLFVKSGVQVVFQGHDHIYERTTPQKGIVYFVVGASGKIREGNTKRTPTVAATNDTEYTFMLVEVVGPEMFFQVISGADKVVDSGTIRAQANPQASPVMPAKVPKKLGARRSGQ